MKSKHNLYTRLLASSYPVPIGCLKSAREVAWETPYFLATWKIPYVHRAQTSLFSPNILQNSSRVFFCEFRVLLEKYAQQSFRQSEFELRYDIKHPGNMNIGSNTQQDIIYTCQYHIERVRTKRQQNNAKFAKRPQKNGKPGYAIFFCGLFANF